jgi:hypothetical protein
MRKKTKGMGDVMVTTSLDLLERGFGVGSKRRFGGKSIVEDVDFKWRLLSKN